MSCPRSTSRKFIPVRVLSGAGFASVVGRYSSMPSHNGSMRPCARKDRDVSVRITQPVHVADLCAGCRRERVTYRDRDMPGVSLFELARFMGTSVEQIDRTYGHLLPDSIARARRSTRSLHVGHDRATEGETS